MDLPHHAAGRAALVRIAGHESEAIFARFGTAPFQRHYHDTYSAGLVLNGVNAFGYRRRSFEIGPGAIGMADPGEVHDGGRAGIAWAYASIFPGAETMTALAEGLGRSGAPCFQVADVTDRRTAASLLRFFRSVFAASGDDPAETATEALSELILRHADARRQPRPPGADGAVARRALAMIHDRWMEGPSLDALARAAGTSPFAVIRAVRAATGLSPHAYLTQLRLMKAKAQMRAGATIVETAFACGFADQAHMTRAMKQRWGVTPGAFRRAYAA